MSSPTFGQCTYQINLSFEEYDVMCDLVKTFIDRNSGYDTFLRAQLQPLAPIFNMKEVVSGNYDQRFKLLPPSDWLPTESEKEQIFKSE